MISESWASEKDTRAMNRPWILLQFEITIKLFMRLAVRLIALLLALCFAARAEQVVISKIMYHPPGALPEYFELYNNTATPLDIANWHVTHAVEYEFPA